jgi:hypothetical protein
MERIVKKLRKIAEENQKQCDKLKEQEAGIVD